MHIHTLGTLSEHEASTLLRTICPRIGATAAELAQHCGYLPLALRVSATFLKRRPSRSVTDYLHKLQDEHTRLATLHDPKDPTLNVSASLALSYHGLSTPAQHALVQLGVFVGSFTPAAAQAVIDVPDNDLADLLDELTLTSLLDVDETTQRYDLHDLVRTFACTHLTDPRPVHLRHAQFYQQVAYHADKDLYEEGQPLAGLTLFDQERRQIDAAWHWLLTQPPTNDTDHLLLDLANATAYIGDLRYDLRHERIPQLQAQASAAQRLDHKEAQGVALGNLGNAYRNLGEVTRAIEYYQQWLTIAREIDDRRGEGNALGNLGNAYADQGEVTRAIEYYQQYLTIARAIGDRRGEGNALGGLGSAYYSLGEVTRAIEYYQQHLTIARAIGDRRGEGTALGNLGIAYDKLEDYSQAITYYEQSLEVSRSIGFAQGVAIDSWNLGLLYEQQGDLTRAIQLMQVYVDFLQQIGHADYEKRAKRLQQLRQRAES